MQESSYSDNDGGGQGVEVNKQEITVLEAAVTRAATERIDALTTEGREHLRELKLGLHELHHAISEVFTTLGLGRTRALIDAHEHLWEIADAVEDAVVGAN